MADSTLPIDIHTNKLLDWLISRRHCKKDFQKSLDLIRVKVKLAIQDMPQIDEVIQLLKENVFDYFVCKRIVEILKNTDKDSKNIFGQYTSKRLLDWQEIVKLYEKDNVYLAEDAQNLIRNVNYEVPSLKKLSAKYEQQISDTERAIELCKKQSKNYQNEFYSNTKKLGIEGVNIKGELVAQLEILPKKLNELSEQLQTLIPVCNYYKTFVFFISQSGIECLPLLHYLLAKGNTTCFEYKTGTTPDIVEEYKLGSLIDFNSTSNNEPSSKVEADEDGGGIDFGDDNGIDFGDDNASTDTPSTSNGDFVKLDKDELSVENEINWDIGDETEVKVDEQTSSSTSPLVARGDDAQSVLLCSQYRNRFINELIEVESFLSERLQEMKSEHMLSSHLFQSAPSVLQLTTQEGVTEMLFKVVAIREAFEMASLKVLYYMKDSPKYIDNVYKKLSHLQTLSEKAIERAANFENKRSNQLTELSSIGPQTASLISFTKTLQQRIEESLSAKYSNRPVNIMGGVQVL